MEKIIEKPNPTQIHKNEDISYLRQIYNNYQISDKMSDEALLVDYIFQVGGEGKNSIKELDDLINLSTVDNKSIRRVVIAAIGRINSLPKKSIPVLMHALFDTDKLVQQYAAAGIGLFSPEDLIKYKAMDYLIKASTSDDSSVREFVNETLSRVEKAFPNNSV